MIWAKEIDPLDDWQEDLFDTGSTDAHTLSDLLDRLAVRLGTEAVVTPHLLSEHQPERAFRYAPLVGAATVRPGPQAACAKAPVFEGQSNIAHTSASKQTSKHRSAEQATYRYGDAATVRHTGASPATNVSRRQKPAAQDGRFAKPHRAGIAARDDTLPPGPRPLCLMSRPTEIAVTSLIPDGPPLSFRYEGRPHAVVHSVGPERIETGWWRGPHVHRDYFRILTDTGRGSWLFRDRRTNRWFLHGWFD